MSTAKIPPKPGKDTVYVDVDDEITAIIEKVEAAKEKVVALVLPKRASVLQSLVNMRLLKRNAEKAAKSVVLITNEELLLPIAGVVGIHVAKDLQSKPEVPSAPARASAAVKKATAAEPDKDSEDYADNDDTEDPEEEPNTKLDYHRTVGELAAVKPEESEPVDLDDDDAQEDKAKAAKTKTPKDKKVKVPNFDRFRLMVAGGAILLILLIVFIILGLFVLPKATITITTESTPISANLTLNAADSIKTLNEANNAIPALLKTSQESSTQTVPATGSQNNGTKATGSVTMTAQACAPNLGTPDSVPAGTGISGGGLTYITQQNASFSFTNFSSGSCANYTTGSVPVTAQSGGAKYNTSISNANVSGAPDDSASGSASGGTDNVITVVSQADLDTAKAKITSADTDTFTKAFESQLASQGYYVLTSTLKPSDPAQTATPAVGQQATNTSVVTQINYTVLVVQKSDLTKVVTDALTKQLDKGKQKLSNNNVLASTTVTVQNTASPSNVTLSVEDSASAVPTLNIANIKSTAAGQKTGDIQSAVSGLPGVKNVSVNLSPFWVSKAPKAGKITVVEQQAKNSGG